MSDIVWNVFALLFWGQGMGNWCELCLEAVLMRGQSNDMAKQWGAQWTYAEFERTKQWGVSLPFSYYDCLLQDAGLQSGQSFFVSHVLQHLLTLLLLVDKKRVVMVFMLESDVHCLYCLQARNKHICRSQVITSNNNHYTCTHHEQSITRSKSSQVTSMHNNNSQVIKSNNIQPQQWAKHCCSFVLLKQDVFHHHLRPKPCPSVPVTIISVSV